MTNLSNGKKIAIFAGIAVVVFGLVFGGIMLTKDVGKSQETITSEQAENQMNKLLGGINVTNVNPIKASISDETWAVFPSVWPEELLITSGRSL